MVRRGSIVLEGWDWSGAREKGVGMSGFGLTLIARESEVGPEDQSSAVILAYLQTRVESYDAQGGDGIA